MSIDLTGAVQSLSAEKAAEPKLKELKKATEGFEAIFLKKLFSQMRSSVKETHFGDTFGKEIYDDMFNEQMANAAAKNHSLGMADMLYKQFAPRVIAEERTRLEMAAKAASKK